MSELGRQTVPLEQSLGCAQALSTHLFAWLGAHEQVSSILRQI
jgi:hypothetical protein